LRSKILKRDWHEGVEIYTSKRISANIQGQEHIGYDVRDAHPSAHHYSFGHEF
jgi:hypothetical protein